MKLRATEGLSVALFHCTLELKFKSKTVGVARQQLHFLCSDKENEAKKAWRCAGHVWFVSAATSIQMLPIDQESRFPPPGTRLL